MRAAKFVESYFDAWNHRDPEGVAEHLSRNGIYCDIPLHERYSHDEWVSSLEDVFSQNPHRYELIGEILASCDTIAYQYRIVPSEQGEPGEHSDSYRGAEFITLHQGTAATIIDYYDVPGIGEPTDLAQMTSRELSRRKYAKSGLDSAHLLEYQERLEETMRSQQMFLQSDLTLPRLAEAVNCSVNHLSQVINSGFGMSFFDYLNQYRIAYAKDVLAESNDRNTAILNIAFSVGFNSNSAFYAAFKKCVGQTPAQYRKAQRDKAH